MKKPPIGVPVRLDDKSLKRVPAPKPSRTQIIEALVTLKIEQVQQELGTWLKESERLEEVALTALRKEMSHIARDKFNEVALPSIDEYSRNEKGVLMLEINPVSLVLHSRHLSPVTRKAIQDYYRHQRDVDGKKPKIEGLSSWRTNIDVDDEDCRRAVRNQIREQLAKQEGTNKDRLVPLLGDKKFRSTLENTLAKLEGKAVVDVEEAEAAEATASKL